MRHRSVLAAAAALAALGLAACQQAATRPACPAGQKCLEYGNSTDPTSLDPQRITSTTEAAIVGELMEGLFSDAPDGSPTPAVAERWETTPDGLVWTFHLRPEKWSDGTPVTADDFVFAYRRMLDPKSGFSYAYLLYLIKNGEAVNGGKAPLDALGVRAIDKSTLELTLEHPAPFLPQILKHQSYFPVPAHAVKRWADAWSQPAHYVGNGPYRLITWRLGDYIRLERNPQYRDAGKICIDRVNFYPTTDAVAAERRVKRGELDVNDTFQSNRITFLRQPGHLPGYVRVHPYLSTTYMIFNRSDVPALKDGRVRHAISMAIDRAFITRKLLRAGQVPTVAFVPSMIAGYVPAGGRHPAPYWGSWALDQRQAEAKRLLAAAGYGPRHPLVLELKTFSTTDSLLVAQALQADEASVGVDVKLIQNDGQVALASFEARDFQLGLVGWIADYNDPMTYLALMKSNTGAQNYGDYKNPTYDALLDKADHEPDGARRAEYLAQAEQLMLDDADVAPIQNGVNRNLVSPRITGWVENAVDIHRIRFLCMKR